ncbi:MAG: hypothetical protein AAF125_18415, partial [Chloroflexota bacterium]
MQANSFWQEINTVSPYTEYKSPLVKMETAPYGLDADGNTINRESNTQFEMIFGLMRNFAAQRAMEDADPTLDEVALKAIADKAAEDIIETFIARANEAAPEGYTFSYEWFMDGSQAHSQEANTFFLDYQRELLGDMDIFYKSGALFDFSWGERLLDLVSLDQLFYT